VGLDPSAPKEVPRRTSAGPRQRAPTPKVPTPTLPPIAAKADDLEAIKQAVDDAAGVGGGLWISYIFVFFYLAVAAGAVTHVDLFFENPVKLPFLNIELPLLAFFFLAPILFLVVHAYTLVHLVMLTDKAKHFDTVLRKQIGDENVEVRDSLRRQLPSNIFIQFLAGPRDVRESWFGWLLRAIAWATLVVAPILLLLLMQIQFLAFHSSFITWSHRIALIADLGLLWWLWRRKILSWRGIDGGPRSSRAWTVVGFVLSFLVVLFSWTAATFPGEWQEDHWPDVRPFLTTDQFGRTKSVSLHDWVFHSKLDGISRRRWLPMSSTLVLTGLNIYEELKIDDPEKVKWRQFVFRARGRDLKGAIFDFANLRKVDFTGAELQGASFEAAQLQGASFDNSELRGAVLNLAQLQGASLNFAQLQGAILAAAALDGATLFEAQLQGVALGLAHLEGATLDGAHLQGAALDRARFQGASLSGARLQGVSLFEAELQGAKVSYAQLQGAWLQPAKLRGTDLSGAYLWRTNGLPSPASSGDVEPPADIELSEAPVWSAFWSDEQGGIHRWDEAAYQHLREMMASLPAGDLRNQALDRIRSLNCASPDPTLASCDPPFSWIPPLVPPHEATDWRKSLEDAHDRDYAAYATTLAAELRSIVCSLGDNATYVLRGLMRERLGVTGPEAPALVDFILSKDCPVSASLTDADKANLLRIKQDAIKKPGG
jgi:hypothetical protein